jgi:hypothetical protein
MGIKYELSNPHTSDESAPQVSEMCVSNIAYSICTFITTEKAKPLTLGVFSFKDVGHCAMTATEIPVQSTYRNRNVLRISQSLCSTCCISAHA